MFGTHCLSIQKQFLLFVLRRMNWRDPYILPPYEARLSLLNLDTLADHRKIATCMFTASCLSRGIKLDSLTPFFQWQRQQRTLRSSSVRRLKPLRIVYSRYVENFPIRRCVDRFNCYAQHYNTSLSLDAFKGKLQGCLLEERKARLGATTSVSHPR